MMDLIYGKLILGTVMHIVEILLCKPANTDCPSFGLDILDVVADQILERFLDEHKFNILYLGTLTIKVNPTNFIQAKLIYLWIPSILL